MNIFKKLKNQVHEILTTGTKDDNKRFVYVIDDYLLTGLIFLNIIAIMLETYEPLFHKYYSYFHIFDVFSVAVFSIEYILRIWIADMIHPELTKTKARAKYIFSFMGIADLLSVLPFYIPFVIKLDLRILRILRLFRLFRIFKLGHYSSSIKMVGNVLKNRKDELLITIFATFILLLLTASIMFHIEHEAQPEKFTNIFSSFWWAVATLTTIGYGDLYPITGWGQFLAALTALFGIGLVAIPTGILSMGFMEELSKKKKVEGEHEEPPRFCPHCGKRLRE